MNRPTVDRPTVDWQKTGGLVPAVVQDAVSGHTLMLGYMNQDALNKTLDTGLVTFFSRSRQALWTKGETSGNRLHLVDLDSDCDNDTLLVRARRTGPVCHTGTVTCFDGRAAQSGFGFLGTLEQVIAKRLNEAPDSSYTAKLAASGLRRIAQKVGEEGVEVALAATAGDDAEVVSESADLLFHLLLLLKRRNLSLADVATELHRRHDDKKTPAPDSSAPANSS
ncbi:MAG: bifunctional phosphoribosyl-AMP cyclohydrolase/phosphoribosyl-ATP diphosphatase HisIE [Pseudomonadota bacterium]